MSIWEAGKLGIVRLDAWNIIQYKGKRNFIGNDMDHYGARISSPIMEYDEEKKTGVTKSGQRYTLHGEPGLDDDALYLLDICIKQIAPDDWSLKWPTASK